MHLGEIMYKLRIYNLTGIDKGNLNHEENFDTKERMETIRGILIWK